ncbi:uncharacterized protein METZ01_LOCUS246896, partial [marine metagenome]
MRKSGKATALKYRERYIRDFYSQYYFSKISRNNQGNL